MHNHREMARARAADVNPQSQSACPSLTAGGGLTRRRLRVLLINPRFPESFWSFRWAVSEVLPKHRALNPPLGLATLAALSPAHWEVRIVDENVESIPLDPDADIIGICGMAVQFPRQRELFRYYRKRGYYVVAGGSYSSLCPEAYEGLVDTVVVGEAEYIWPQFCCDYEQRKALSLYRETGVVDLNDSPTPRFDLLKLETYRAVSVQFSRGCPFRCEFCDIIVMFGRRPRTKRAQQVGLELDRLRSLGVRNVFFVDDNLIGNRPRAKELLRFLIDYQDRHQFRFEFGTEVSLNLAEDQELLKLFSAANFGWVFIGIESPDEDSLKETKKTQNTGRDILHTLQRIYQHGIDVLGGFIIGFDNDTLDTFSRQHTFIRASGVQVAMVGLLKALPKTPLYERLRSEGRLIDQAEHGDNTGLGTNFLPKRMDYEGMLGAYKRLYHQLVSNRGIADRIRNKLIHLRRPVANDGYSMRQRLSILMKFGVRGLMAGGPGRWYHFWRTLCRHRPVTWPLAVSDWIAGLAMRDFVQRNFPSDLAYQHRLAKAASDCIRRRAARLRDGIAEVTLTPVETGAHLVLRLTGTVDRRFLSGTTRRLRSLLRRSTATLTLCIDELGATKRIYVSNSLRRLARYGDRISINVGEALRPALAIDSSVFHLVLDESR